MGLCRPKEKWDLEAQDNQSSFQPSVFSLPFFPLNKIRSGKKDFEKYLKENCIARKKWLFIPGQRPPRGLTGADCPGDLWRHPLLGAEVHPLQRWDFRATQKWNQPSGFASTMASFARHQLQDLQLAWNSPRFSSRTRAYQVWGLGLYLSVSSILLHRTE